ncbi:MAG: hypothetical protein IH905_17355 [Proteobacteria bacterium]|nr:hypothetical protein [Pseudomonadota bacterium]
METKSNYPRRLAQSLIRSVGVEEAVYFALQNQWMGVLAHLPKDAPLPTTRHPAPRTRVVTAAIGAQVS